MSDTMRVINRKQIMIGNYGSVYIEEVLGGGYRVLIDTHEENIWLGFKEPGVTHYVYWKTVLGWHKEKLTVRPND